jgi:hypothetical protein
MSYLNLGRDLGLGGKLNAKWTGKGPLKIRPNIEVHGDQIRTKTVQRIQFDVAAKYRGMNAEIPACRSLRLRGSGSVRALIPICEIRL